MSFPLDNFEKHLPKDICRKGLDYFQEDSVDNLTQDGDVWEADVYGTDEYIVEVTVTNGMVEDWDCDCPYDYGPVCKHVAAVLFAIRDEVSEEPQPPAEPKRPGRKPKQAVAPAEPAPDQKRPGRRPKQVQQTPVAPAPRSKTKAASDPLAEIISKLGEAEMRATLEFLAGRHNEVKAHLLSKYAAYISTVSKAHYRQLVASIIRVHEGRHGFIDYRESSRLGRELCKLVDEADEKATLNCIYVCEEVVRQSVKAIQQADDSSGSIGEAIEAAFEKLDTIAKAPDTPAEALRYLFEFAVKESQNSQYEGWDWANDLRELAANATRSKEQAESLIGVLDKQIAANSKEKYSNYTVQRDEQIKLGLITQWRSKHEADAYLNSRLHYADFRKMALKKAMEEKRYEAVRSLAEEGIKLDTQNKFPGLVEEWRKWLVRLAEVTGDKKEQAEMIEKMYLDRGEMVYFRQLKALLSKKAFAEKVEQFIQYFKQRNAHYSATREPFFSVHLANIFVEEKRLDDLMTEILKSPYLHLLDQYRNLLSKPYRAVYLELYEKGVREQMKQASNRAQYQECCKVIKTILQLDGRDQARQIVQDWQRQYTRRPAMQEELKKLKLE
ncbi:MAG: SWIM zinc finger family protein [Saprospiraceae bacterium]|nr:SWIM zinc finger family protein [Saprospiraceae bacterium]